MYINRGSIYNGTTNLTFLNFSVVGSTETAQFLLDIGAPAGVYDSEGNSAIAHLVEKMPHVGYRALHQFIVSNMPLKRSEMYLSYLETNTRGKSGMIAKSPLEVKIVDVFNNNSTN